MLPTPSLPVVFVSDVPLRSLRIHVDYGCLAANATKTVGVVAGVLPRL